MKLKALSVALLLILSVAVLSACGGSDDSSTPSVTSLDQSTAEIDPADIKPYPESVKAEFVKSCSASSGGKKSACECIIKAYEDTLPLDMYQALNNTKAGLAPPPVPQATQEAANACFSGGSS